MLCLILQIQKDCFDFKKLVLETFTSSSKVKHSQTYSKPTSPGIDPSRIFGAGANGRALLILVSFSAFKAVETLDGPFTGAKAAADPKREAQIREVFIVIRYSMN